MGRRKTSAKKDETETVNEGAAIAVAETPKEQATDLKDEERPAAKAAPEADRFRSWITDRSTNYEHLTDEKSRLLVLKFGNKPEPDVLDKLKGDQVPLSTRIL